MILANCRLCQIHCTVADSFLKPVANVLDNYSDQTSNWLNIQTITENTKLLPGRIKLLSGIGWKKCWAHFYDFCILFFNFEDI